MSHNARVRQSPGWWPSLVEGTCSCGWHGPTRDLNTPAGHVLAQLDTDEHVAAFTDNEEDSYA